MKRRDFIGLLTRLAGTALGGFILYPVLRYLVPPSLPEAATRRVVAAKRDDLVPGSFKIFPFGGQPGILVRTASGEHRAFSAVCTHLGCTVQYRSEDRMIWCACHDGLYDLEGRVVSGPPPRALERFEVHEAGADLVVERPEAT